MSKAAENKHLIVFITNDAMVYVRYCSIIPEVGQRFCIWSDYLNVPDKYYTVHDTLLFPSPQKCRYVFKALDNDTEWNFLLNKKTLPVAIIRAIVAPKLAPDFPEVEK